MTRGMVSSNNFLSELLLRTHILTSSKAELTIALDLLTRYRQTFLTRGSIHGQHVCPQVADPGDNFTLI